MSNVAQDLWAGVATAGAVIPAGKWLYRRVRNYQLADNFVKDMAENHLPHIYDALRQLCAKEGIELGDPPPIQFVNPKNLGKD